MRRVVTSWILVAVCASAAWGIEPANRQANPKVKAVLEYFYSLAGKTDNRIISGQFTDFGNGSNLRIMERIHEATGRWPAFWMLPYPQHRPPEIDIFETADQFRDRRTLAGTMRRDDAVPELL